MKFSLRILLFIFYSSFFFAKAESDTPETFVVMCTGTGYTDETWWYSGSSQGFSGAKIKEMWDSGRRITNVAYNANGWFVSSACNTEYSMQTYHYNKDFPTAWINQNFKNGYYITSVAQGDGNWFVLMSQGTDIDSQCYFLSDENYIGNTIKSYWDKGYRITLACPYNGKWFVVMSHNSKYGMQTYAFRNSFQDAQSFIKSKWNDAYCTTCWYSNGYATKYFIVMSQYADGHPTAEAWTSGTNPSSNIKTYWDKGYRITCIGGHKHSINSTLCTACSGSGKIYCAGCNGTGYSPYFGPCGLCASTGRANCLACSGAGRFSSELLAYSPPSFAISPSNVANSSNLSRAGVPNANIVYTKYLFGDNWRKGSDGNNDYWYGESTISIDVAALKIKVSVSGKSYSFDICSVGYAQKMGEKIIFYTTNERTKDESITLFCLDRNSDLHSTEFAWIESKKIGQKITLNTLKNQSSFTNFFDKIKIYLDKSGS